MDEFNQIRYKMGQNRHLFCRNFPTATPLGGGGSSPPQALIGAGPEDQYFLIASEINEIIEEFQCNLQLNFDDNKRQEHYQSIGSTNSRIQQKLQS